MHVNILSYTSGKERHLATIRLDDEGQIVTRGRLPDGVKQVLADAYERAESPEAFLTNLPNEFMGSMIRAIPVGRKRG